MSSYRHRFNYRFYPSILKAARLLTRESSANSIIFRYAGYSAKDHNHEWLHDADLWVAGVAGHGIHSSITLISQ